MPMSRTPHFKDDPKLTPILGENYTPTFSSYRAVTSQARTQLEWLINELAAE